ncbi:MAG: Gfo/Idh/MocA family oxidoreductase [Verrucomicrobia bacterium]|nr:MAG: Gfo/Idh/MocA family oxidoreductase [Verrucomicrobiota bacterium]
MPMIPISRRRFLETSGKTTATLAAGSALLALPRAARGEAPSNRVVLALVGAGGRAASHAAGMSALPGVEFKYVCDVWKDRGVGIMKDLAKVQKRAPQRIADMRVAFDDKEVDGVVIATPEHWHALATVWACQAGKDVYVEKNPANSIWEGRKMIEAARKYGRIVQVGFQNRSGPYAASARDYIAAGKLGRIVHVKVYNLLDGSKWEAKPDRQPPEGLDWDAWLGPAPEVPYNPGRHMDWHPWWDYKGGTLADDAIHQLDLTRMVLGNPAHPKSVLCIGGNYAFQSRREVPEFQCITYDYGDFAMTCESGNATGYMRKFPGEVRYGDKWPHWPTSATRVEIYGTKALMYLGRHGCGWQVVVEGGKILDQDKGYFPDKWHQPNFIDCMRSRKQPNADIGDAHRSACLVHMANTSYRVGQRHLHFDGQAERYTNSDEANALLKPAFRKHYRIPETV